MLQQREICIILFVIAVLKEIQNTLDVDSSFRFFIPAEPLQKAEEQDGMRIIQGIASTNDRDLQGEIVKQNGIDYEYFLKHGYINDDHKDGPEHKIGEPLECKITAKGFWLKAFLYKGKDQAEKWWDHLKALENNKSKRKVGFSIQGKVVRRNGSTILKCWLQDVAITASPVNTSTWTEIIKSLNNEKWCIHPKDPVCKSGCCSCSAKSCSNADKDEQKALSTSSGSVLVPESLEGSAKVQTLKSLNYISYPNAIKLIQMRKGCSFSTAKAFADAIFTAHGIH